MLFISAIDAGLPIFRTAAASYIDFTIAFTVLLL
jgi:hypothetical protein